MRRRLPRWQCHAIHDRPSPLQAQRSFESVLADDAQHWRARYHLALLRVAQAEWSDAEELLHRVLADNPAHTTAQELLGKLAERRDAELNRLKPPDPDDTKAWAQLEPPKGSAAARALEEVEAREAAAAPGLQPPAEDAGASAGKK